MICDEVRRMLGAYVDKELELTRQPDLEKHLTGCPSCQAAAEEINNFSSLIRMNIPVYKTPGELKAKIQASLRRESRPKLKWFSRISLPVDLHNFFNDRLYDPALEQGIGAPYRRQEALLNDRYFGKKTVVKPQDIVSPAPQRIIPLRCRAGPPYACRAAPFSITSVAELMADLFDWNPVRTLEEINACLELCARKPGYGLASSLRSNPLTRELQPKNSTAPVSRLYIAPVILTVPLASSSASTGLSFRISATVISTFLRATASTKA